MDWTALEARTDRAVLGAFGESVRLSFLKAGAADPARPATDSRGLLHVGGDDSKPSTSDGMRARLAAGMAELFLDRAVYTGAMPKKDDMVRANARRGQPWFKVTSVSDRDTNLLVVSLSEA